MLKGFQSYNPGAFPPDFQQSQKHPQKHNLAWKDGMRHLGRSTFAHEKRTKKTKKETSQ